MSTATGGALERVVLHVGLYKTGTTYLQNLLRENQEPLRRAGIYVAPRRRHTTFAALDVVDRQFRGTTDARIPGAWDRLVAAVHESGLPGAVISEERLGVASARQARRAVSSFGSARVDVVVTVRDLSRVLVSHWQEDVKNGGTLTLEQYATALSDPATAGVSPAVRFWIHEDVTAVLRAWSSVVPVDRIHVVTVPPAGAPPGLLIERFASAAGFRPADVPHEPEWGNENVGAVGTELLRRLNERLGSRLNGVEHERGVKIPLARPLASMPGKGAVVMPPEHREWIARTAATYVDEIRAAGYDVVGDLSDLTPAVSVRDDDAAEPSTPPAPPDDSALLEGALEALTAVTSRQGHVLAAAEKLRVANRGELADRRTRVQSRMRNLGFRGKRAAVTLASRTTAGRRLTASFLRRRAGR